MAFKTLWDLICGLPGLTTVFRSSLKSSTDLRLENAALRNTVQQQADQLKKLGCKRLVSKPADRLFWALLFRFWKEWKSALLIYHPRTIKHWHDNLFANFWKRKSKPGTKPKRRGRPPIPKADIAIIRQIARDNPTWGAEHIADEMRIKLGVAHSPQTIKKYIPRNRTPNPGKPWWTFLSEHKEGLLCCDFFQQHLINFQVVYVFVVMHLETRKVVGFGVTAHPTLDFVKQQLRQALWENEKPRFILHDNDGIFGNFPNPVVSNGRRYRNHLDQWLKETMGITGIRTPYRAPRANSVVERYQGSLRRECLNHYLFFSVGHVQRVLREYQVYFNRHRTHAGIEAIPNPNPDSGYVTEKPVGGKLVAFPHMGGLVHELRWAA